jgi:hypothetical protein
MEMDNFNMDPPDKHVEDTWKDMRLHIFRNAFFGGDQIVAISSDGGGNK